MLTAHHIHKTYGIQPILQDISFSISNNERVGLIGPNGCGKTTLMRILAGTEQPDSGTVASTRPNLRIGYLAQGMDFEPDQTLQTALSLNPVSQAELEAEIASLALALTSNPNDATLHAKYDIVLTRLSTLDVRPESVLGPLGRRTSSRHSHRTPQRRTKDSSHACARFIGRTMSASARRTNQPSRYRNARMARRLAQSFSRRSTDCLTRPRIFG